MKGIVPYSNPLKYCLSMVIKYIECKLLEL